MQIHEITHKTQINEAVGDVIGYTGGKAVSGIKNVGSAIMSPFKDIAQGYKSGRMDQQTAALADKMYRAWQNYSVQWAKSQGGKYTAPGAGASATKTPATGSATKTSTAPVAKNYTAANLFSVMQALDDRQLGAIAKILSQRVGPEATMAALKRISRPAAGQLDEVDWRGLGSSIKQTASAVGQQIKQGVQLAPQLAKQVGQGYKKAAQAGMSAVKAAPGAVATGVGATVGSVAGMPARASTAYRTAKGSVSGPQMTMTELQTALYSLPPAEAKKLLDYVQQIQKMRKAGIKEGVDVALVPGWEQALRAFVQKNMLSGMQYSRLQNAQQIDTLIKQIVDPANDSETAQKSLWNQLTLAASVAQHAPAQAGGQPTAATSGSGASTASAVGGTEDAATLKDAMVPVFQQLGQDKNAATIGSAVRKTFTNNSPDINSTGVPAVDAMLMTMGFRPQ